MILPAERLVPMCSALPKLSVLAITSSPVPFGVLFIACLRDCNGLTLGVLIGRRVDAFHLQSSFAPLDMPLVPLQ